MARLNTILLGGCLTRWPLNRTQAAAGRLALEKYSRVPEMHTFGEMFQVVEILRGQKTLPSEVRALAHVSPLLRAVPGADDFADVDVVLLEPASTVEMEFRGFIVNRFGIMERVRRHVDETDKPAKMALAAWMRYGLVGLDEAARVKAAKKLVPFILGNSEKSELARAVVRETRSYPSDIPGGFRRMRELFCCPIGVAHYVFRYMPDGRPVIYPPGLRERVLEAAGDLPIFDPIGVVTGYGVEAALDSALSHYSPEFMPVIGTALVEFIESVHRRGMAW